MSYLVCRVSIFRSSFRSCLDAVFVTGFFLDALLITFARPLTVFLFVLRIREPLSTTDTINASFGAVFLFSNAIESTVTFWALLDFRCSFLHQHKAKPDE